MSQRATFSKALERDDPAGGPAAQAETAGSGAGSSGTATPPERPAEPIPLDFLAPSQKPGSLGRLGHYEVLEVVGRGAMGIVLRAFDEKLHRVVAIKALAPALATAGSARQRFLREARAAAAVTHENVIDIHAVENNAVPYLVMQFINGPTLQRKIEGNGPFPVKEILRIGLQVAAGLAAAHAQGLVHRDVKPANILLENGIERIKITDFGLARAVDDASLTQSGVIAGTPGYMSPEQANGEKVDHRSDLFSLGSVLYTLCAGHPPFRAESTMAVLKRVCEETPRPLREINADVPEWLAAIVARLQAKDPDGRFQTAAEVVEVLGRHLTELQQPGRGMAPVGRVSNLAVERTRGKRVPQVTPVLVILVVALLGASFAAYHTFWLPDRASNAAPAKGHHRPLTPDELAKLPNPLDARKRQEIPLALLCRSGRGESDRAPQELVAVLGDGSFLLPRRENTHWMAQTADGRLLAVPCGNTVVLYEAGTGALVRTLTGHTSRCYRPAFSPDGKRLACGAINPTIRIWDVDTGQPALALEGQDTNVLSVAFDPDGTRLASGSWNGTVRVWDAVKGEVVHTLAAHSAPAHDVAFSPDGTRLASVGWDKLVKVWDPKTGEPLQTLEGHTDMVLSAAYRPGGKILATGSESQVVLWDTETYQPLHTLNTAGAGVLGFTPDGQTLVTAGHDLRKPDSSLAFSRWDVKTGSKQATLALPGPGGLLVGRLGNDGRTLWCMNCDPPDNRVGAYDAETGAERFPGRGHRGAVRCVAVSPDGHTIASAGDDHAVCLWDLAGWRPGEPQPPVRTLAGHSNAVWSVGFSPDGKLLASGGLDGLIILWDAASGRKVHDLTGHSTVPSYLTFSPDGRTIAAGGKDGTVNHWDVVTGQPQEPWRWHVGEVRPVAYSPDGRLLASGGKDATVQLVDTANGQRRHFFRGSTPFTNLAFSPDGKVLAGVSEAPGAALRLWDPDTYQERALTGHTNHILGLAYHPGGRSVATASCDGSVRLWDVTAGKEIQTLDFRGSGEAYGVAFTPEGRYLAVGLQDGTIALLRSGPP